ncbi:TetR/AcrR family transcriptional regulator [Alcaligenes sp. 13f]|uniref:TetR/AcrR family transcriptional regulator n=1 Tax=Alcaligenes sp. 13f TaxID=2841924 RepID=UPI001CF677C8|nr:TetR/AcrR family transcriptional regulator [Alcaligenes sp. 13f]MCB4321417.1 TetR/AcrR family transcriptional regulator [Alcaligenes sp. 13f]
MENATSHRKESAHDRLLSAAAILFYNDGIAATGIDAIVKKAGVAKKSLYNNFASKADVVAQYLQIRHAEWISLYEARVRQAQGPAERVLAVFDAYADHAEHAYERGFRGCGLLNAAAEFPAGDAGREAVRAHKEEVETLLLTHLAELMPSDDARVTQLARHLAFLLEGGVVRAGLEGNSDCVVQSKCIAASLLEAA